MQCMVERLGTIKGLLNSILDGLLQAKANNPPLNVDSSYETSLVGQYHSYGGERSEQMIRKICQAAAFFVIDEVCRT